MQQKTDIVIEKIKNREFSVGRAARELGISIIDFLDLLKEKKIDWIGYNDEDLERDLFLLKSEVFQNS